MYMLWMVAAGWVLAAETVTLTAHEWPVPHRTETIAGYPPLVALVQALTKRDENVLVIRHAGGEAGERLAETLRQALVSLGVPSNRLRLEPAAAGRGELILELTTRR